MTRDRSYGVPLGEVIREAFDNLRARGQRSILALLGIVIGTASIIAMLNVGHMAQLETLKQFARLGLDTILVQSMSTQGSPPDLGRATVERLPKTDPDVLDATPFAIESRPAFARQRDAQVMIAAAPPKLMSVLGLTVAQGRALTPIDDCSAVAVVGKNIPMKFGAGDAELIGEEVALGNYLFTVVGVLGPTLPEPLSGMNYDEAIVIPLPCSVRVMAGSGPTGALVKVRDGANVEQVGMRLQTSLANETTAVQTFNAKMIIEARNQQKVVHSRMLAAIGGISLLVGGIGVMNVMLMNVMERRKEIGLRAAVGATPRDIQAMFLLEAAMLATVGGLAGALLGLIASAVIADLSGWSFSIAYRVLPLGPGGAAVIGLLFGIYPAISASRIDPIEALRAE